MFQKEFTNTLHQLAHRGMSDVYSFREFRKRETKADLNPVKKKQTIKKESIQLNLFQQ